MQNNRYLVLYKPYLTLSQFTSEGDTDTLQDLGLPYNDIYPIGRLDKDSEGLLLLSSDKRVNHLLLDPKFEHARKYLVQVEGIPTDESITQLEQGVEIKLKRTTYVTKPCTIRKLVEEPALPKRIPPIRYRKDIPTTWLEMVLKEGKNRQVRKMTARIGHGTLRLVRHSIENISIDGLLPGGFKEVDKDYFYSQLRISEE